VYAGLGRKGVWTDITTIGNPSLFAPFVTQVAFVVARLKLCRRSNLLLSSVFSSATALTYLLFWMIAYNLCHVF
jgi:hypothetical protein